MYQGHFWDSTIIPSFGYREDKTLQRGNTAHQNDLDGDGVNDTDTGFYREVKTITDKGVSATTHSRSYGVAIHLPKFIKQNLPASEGGAMTAECFGEVIIEVIPPGRVGQVEVID